MGNPQERPLSREFIAGLVVGEGYFGIGVRRSTRLQLKRGFSLCPVFTIQMRDVATMQRLVFSLRHYGLSFYVPASQKWILGERVDMQGMKRVKRFIDFIKPHLTGDKLKAAAIVDEFISLRLAKKAPAPYGEEEFRLVDAIRAVNSGKNRLVAGPAALKDIRSWQRTTKERSQLSEAT
jgi:hypothetical protein